MCSCVSSLLVCPLCWCAYACFTLQLPQTNPGYNNTPFKFTKYSNAYMLVYIRVSDKDKIICDVDEKDIAEHLRVILKWKWFNLIIVLHRYLSWKITTLHAPDKIEKRTRRKRRQEKIQSAGAPLYNHQGYCYNGHSHVKLISAFL